MHILYVVPYVPSQIYVRPYNLVRALVENGHQVSLGTLWSNESDRQALRELASVCEDIYAYPLQRSRTLINLLATLPSKNPLQAGYCWQTGLMRQLIQVVGNHGKRRIDSIHIEHLRGARYGISLLNLRKQRVIPGLSTIPIIWDSVDSISHLFRQAASQSARRMSRWMTRFELGRTERYESWLINQFDHVTVTSSIDKNALLALASPHQHPPEITVLPNGVDLTYFQPGNRAERQPATLVISGKMSYHANVTMVLYFFNEILPLIWQSHPVVNLWIVGKDPTREIQMLAADPRIKVTGMVPDIRPYLQKATIAVSPIRYGAGIQNKVLEAMACGTPVVCTPQAVAAIAVEDDHDIVLASEARSYASKVIQLLENEQKWQSIAQAGRQYVENHHDWGQIASRLAKIHQTQHEKLLNGQLK
jgi:polysaccharide biosynthesis protein PslH